MSRPVVASRCAGDFHLNPKLRAKLWLKVPVTSFAWSKCVAVLERALSSLTFFIFITIQFARMKNIFVSIFAIWSFFPELNFHSFYKNILIGNLFLVVSFLHRNSSPYFYELRAKSVSLKRILELSIFCGSPKLWSRVGGCMEAQWLENLIIQRPCKPQLIQLLSKIYNSNDLVQNPDKM